MKVTVASQNDESGIGLPLVCRISVAAAVVVFVRYVMRVCRAEFGCDVGERRGFAIFFMRDAENEVQSNLKYPPCPVSVPASMQKAGMFSTYERSQR